MDNRAFHSMIKIFYFQILSFLTKHILVKECVFIEFEEMEKYMLRNDDITKAIGRFSIKLRDSLFMVSISRVLVVVHPNKESPFSQS